VGARQPFELAEDAVVVGARRADEADEPGDDGASPLYEAPARGPDAAGRPAVCRLAAGGILPCAQAASAFCLMLSYSPALIVPSSSSFFAEAI
jgi:hypothetical protein